MEIGASPVDPASKKHKPGPSDQENEGEQTPQGSVASTKKSRVVTDDRRTGKAERKRFHNAIDKLKKTDPECDSECSRMCLNLVHFAETVSCVCVCVCKIIDLRHAALVQWSRAQRVGPAAIAEFRRCGVQMQICLIICMSLFCCRRV